MGDLRNAVRSLAATPVVSAVAILTLALGIGANTAIFSIIDSLLLRALPVREPQKLALLVDQDGNDSWTHPIWEQVRRRTGLFGGVLAWSTHRFNLADRGESEYAAGVYVSGSFFDVLGASAMLGRTLNEADDQRGGGPDGPVAVISYAFWQKRFGGDAGVIGRKLNIDRVSFTVVGVTPPEFFGPEVGSSFDVAIPIGSEPLLRGKDSWLDRRSAWWLQIEARLKAGQSFASATEAIRGVQPAVRTATLPERWRPQDLDKYLSAPLRFEPAATGTSSLRGRYREPLTALLTVVGLVLLIACANIANLLLARGAARRHELSVRLALGASRFRLARQLFAESLLLALVGAAGGLLVAFWGSRLLVNQISTQTRIVFLDLSLDFRVLFFTAAVAFGTALIFGVAPALRSTKVEPIEALKERGRADGGAKSIGLHNALVVAQVALSLLLLVAAGLFVRTFTKLTHLDLGFQQERILIANCKLPRRPDEATATKELFERLEEAVSEVPGVSGAATSIVTPLAGFTWQERVKVPDGPELSERQRIAHYNLVNPGWFGTFGTAVLAGRDFDDHDRADAPQVAIVNQEFARHFLNGGNPVGRTFLHDGGREPDPRPVEIVGLVEDAVYRTLRDPVPPTVYVPLRQSGGTPSFFSLSIRSEGQSPALLTRGVVEAIEKVEPDAQISFRLLSDQVDSALIQERLVAWLSAFFGGLALLLAGIGLYGVTSYAVSRRRFEIGVRMALGAAPGQVLRMILWRVALLVGLGALTGGAAALWFGGLAKSLLFGLEPRDPATYGAAILLLALVGTLAGWMPASRASRFDPARVLRGDS